MGENLLPPGAGAATPAAGGALPERVDVLGVRVSAVTLAGAVATMAGWIARGERQYVCVTPAHGVMDCLDDPALREIFNRSGMTTPDGMSIVWLLRLRGRRGVERVYGPDLVEAVCAASPSRGWRHAFYGGAEGVAERLSARLRERFPGLEVVLTRTPPFRPETPEEDEATVRALAAARPDFAWVGLSTPKQERWMAAHAGRIGVSVLVGVGAAFDFLSGAKPQAPRWVQRCGLEWLFRLATEPRRLAPRYARYPRFAALAIAQLVRERAASRRGGG